MNKGDIVVPIDYNQSFNHYGQEVKPTKDFKAVLVYNNCYNDPNHIVNVIQGTLFLITPGYTYHYTAGDSKNIFLPQKYFKLQSNNYEIY